MKSNSEMSDIPDVPATAVSEVPPSVDVEAPIEETPLPPTPLVQERSVYGELKALVVDIQSLLKQYIFVIVIAFLAIFVVLRIVGGQESIVGSWASHMIDLFVLAILFTWIGYEFLFVYSGEQRNASLKEAWESYKSYISDAFSILYTSLFIVAFYTFVYVVGIPMGSDTQSIFVGLVDKGAWLTLIASVAVWASRTFFDVSIFGPTVPKEEDRVVAETEMPQVATEEVFNIGNNRYTYEDAQSICKSYGARLATYDEIEAAYNKGAEWCNYGWSADQMAFFPTQKSTWMELQKDPKRKNDCGRPGVNGGYMVNPYFRFGVNCYGKKPEPSVSELAKMHVRKETIVPKTKEEVELDMKVQFWKENADKLLSINAFNQNKWSQYK